MPAPPRNRSKSRYLGADTQIEQRQGLIGSNGTDDPAKYKHGKADADDADYVCLGSSRERVERRQDAGILDRGFSPLAAVRPTQSEPGPFNPLELQDPDARNPLSATASQQSLEHADHYDSLLPD